MEKKNNEDEADYSDVTALYEAINDDTRETDIDTWKSDLEAIFDVDGFLKWLAVNTVIQNWDTYGKMTHNYYLYNNHETDQLTWIPWDNNEAFSSGKGGATLSLQLDEVNNNWPLIRYIIDDSDYRAIYDSYVQQFVDEVFAEEKMEETYTSHYNLIKDYAYEELSSDQSFDSAVEYLQSHVTERKTAAQDYLEI